MGMTCEIAALDGTGLDPRTLDELRAAAGRAGAGLADLEFNRALDQELRLPPRAADVDRVVVFGIGGSALGARCVHQACPGAGVLPITVVDNIDPEAFEQAWRGGDPRRTAWVVVSKSGGTTETLAQGALLRARLGADGGWNRVRIVTGARGPLRDLANADGLDVYDVPEDVGGRYSVFTPAATVALALAGHDVAALLAGARDARDHCGTGDSAAARIAALLIAGSRVGKQVVTLWTYAERLEPVGEWFRQLWAESLGKVRGDGVRVGQTPVHCVGSTDQHSIQQLMVEGPRDKVVLVLAGPPTGDLRAPAEGAGAGAGHAFAGILDAMRRATTAEMVRAGSPALTLKLDDWTERSMGALLLAFLDATVLGGHLLDVDPFGQPGVEAAKVATKKLLSEPGGSEDRAIARLLGEGEGLHCP